MSGKLKGTYDPGTGSADVRMIPVQVDSSGNFIIAPGSAISGKVVDDAASGGPYYILSDTDGVPKLGSDGVSNFVLVTNAAGELVTVPGHDGASTQQIYTDTSGGIFNMYDGASYYVQKSDGNGQGYVLQGALLPGEDSGNDLRKVKKVDTLVYTPAKTAATAVDDTEDEILASVEVLSYPSFSIYVKNVGGGSADDLLNVIIYTSPDDTNWVDMDATKDAIETDCETLASGETGLGYRVSGNSFRYVKVGAICAGGDDTTVDCWIVANKG
jgi:hypothetical protein